MPQTVFGMASPGLVLEFNSLISGAATKSKRLVMRWKQIGCAGLLYPTDDDAGTRVMRDSSTITELRITVESLRQFKHSSILMKV